MATIRSLKLQWSTKATADTASFLDYIGEDNPNAALMLLDEIDHRVAMLKHQPKMGRVGRVSGTRELVVHKNYVVIYKEDSVKVEILRVLHAKQMWPI